MAAILLAALSPMCLFGTDVALTFTLPKFGNLATYIAHTAYKNMLADTRQD